MREDAGAGRRVLLSGWGRTAPTAARLARPRDLAELAELVARAPERGVIARGLGRSYGDAAQCAGGLVLDCADLDPGFRVDAAAGTVTASAGTSLDTLLRELVPRGWFPPVVPGTRHVTVGGAIAADIHGKNHHADSSFGAHLRSYTVVTGTGEVRTLRPGDGAPFWAGVGGMGLTGVITEAVVALRPVETAWMRVDTDRTPDLDATLDLMARTDGDYHHTVAWVDLLAAGARTGRSVVTRGHHAVRDDLPVRARRDPLRFAPRVLGAAPGWAPPGLLNRWTVRAFNTAWYARAPQRRRDEITPASGFFHPLDAVRGWNRLYGPRGLVQYQFAVPFGAEPVLRRVVERLSAARAASFLAVLKRFGPGTPGPLSFPQPGWTLALDLPAELSGLPVLLDTFDRWVADAGGRVYLAKDSRMHPELPARMYPRLDEWRAVRAEVDPAGVFRSDLARRLDLVGGGGSR
ncbi:FAD-binding oxidoreductase [Allonocardiopsis opalescens]|uniref:Decaprenylphospho-beta-D-ribofuranose 2-oxidase n=1 Tax=Allonocardiopsis opalescens TaxID=1144618 RepID=A0A2T0QCB8_9ACTN|nr:FAD-binding oxidoreductase [Allonocardiopsis opalescens]PRY01596.1 decaprenylphospho-beta-D-ribofuranose 2-oxidase [Allonocardiopsis opalescens]